MNKMIGHKKQKDFLTKITNIPHAFLFCGPDMIGKKTLAIVFSKLILCDNNACNQCKICTDIDKNIYPDLCIISEEKNNIEIDKIRALKEFLMLKSYNNKKKIAIIDNAHLMGIDSQNSILKILEEPPKDSILILVTGYKEMILGTIKSRVQTVNFNEISKQEIQEYLISKGSSKKDAEDISFFSGGKLGKAIELLNNKEKKEFFSKTLIYLKNIRKYGFEKRFEYVKEIYEEKEMVIEVLNIFERFFRRTMFLKLYRQDCGDFNDYSLLKIKEIIEEVGKTKYYFSNTNTNKKLLLENLMINI